MSDFLSEVSYPDYRKGTHGLSTEEIFNLATKFFNVLQERPDGRFYDALVGLMIRADVELYANCGFNSQWCSEELKELVKNYKFGEIDNGEPVTGDEKSMTCEHHPV